eukprot:7336909-Alexandrium_andersonii.AAC.1
MAWGAPPLPGCAAGTRDQRSSPRAQPDAQPSWPGAGWARGALAGCIICAACVCLGCSSA